MNQERPLTSVRLDVWLDVACLFATRSKAKTACEGGKVEVNGSRGKAHREVRVGDRLALSLAPGTRREVIVRGLADRSVPKAQARLLYEDVTPPLSPQALEVRRLGRMLGGRDSGGRPDKRERRERRRQKGW
jgi:ribosome-associated heat shock protein Hsp15